MKGFDAEFRDIDHYIRLITERIWEGRRIGDIQRYYSDDCAVETPHGVTKGIEPVIRGTLDTLATFPDRRLLAEDIVVSGDERGGFLSSHRIVSPMTHAGAGAFGPATGRRVVARTIADCVCRDNRIIHEWLVRDQAAIARQVGIEPRELARRWLDERGFTPATPPEVPAGYRSFIDDEAVAAAYAGLWSTLWQGRELQALSAAHDEATAVAIPGGETLVGHAHVQQFWAGWLASFENPGFSVEHLVANRRPGRCDVVAMRWRLRGHATGAGRYARGVRGGAPLQVLGISHAEFVSGRIVREWILVDEVAVWMQILAGKA